MTWYYCESCNQVFRDYDRWSAHANGPFADIDEATAAMSKYDSWEDVPRHKCYYPRSEVT